MKQSETNVGAGTGIKTTCPQNTQNSNEESGIGGLQIRGRVRCKYKYRPDGQPTFQASPSLWRSSKWCRHQHPALTKIAPAGSLHFEIGKHCMEQDFFPSMVVLSREPYTQFLVKIGYFP